MHNTAEHYLGGALDQLLLPVVMSEQQTLNVNVIFRAAWYEQNSSIMISFLHTFLIQNYPYFKQVKTLMGTEMNHQISRWRDVGEASEKDRFGETWIVRACLLFNNKKQWGIAHLFPKKVLPLSNSGFSDKGKFTEEKKTPVMPADHTVSSTCLTVLENSTTAINLSISAEQLATASHRRGLWRQSLGN